MHSLRIRKEDLQGILRDRAFCAFANQCHPGSLNILGDIIRNIIDPLILCEDKLARLAKKCTILENVSLYDACAPKINLKFSQLQMYEQGLKPPPVERQELQEVCGKVLSWIEAIHQIKRCILDEYKSCLLDKYFYTILCEIEGIKEWISQELKVIFHGHSGMIEFKDAFYSAYLNIHNSLLVANSDRNRELEVATDNIKRVIAEIQLANRDLHAINIPDHKEYFAYYQATRDMLDEYKERIHSYLNREMLMDLAKVRRVYGFAIRLRQLTNRINSAPIVTSENVKDTRDCLRDIGRIIREARLNEVRFLHSDLVPKELKKTEDITASSGLAYDLMKLEILKNELVKLTQEFHTWHPPVPEESIHKNKRASILLDSIKKCRDLAVLQRGREAFKSDGDLPGVALLGRLEEIFLEKTT